MSAEAQNGEAGPSLWCHWVNSCAGLTESARAKFTVFARWQLAWALGLAAITVGKEFGIGLELANWNGVAVGFTALLFVLACLTLRAYARFLRSADELTRKVQEEGLRLGLAVVVIYLSIHPLAELFGVSPVQFTTPLFLLQIGHLIGQARAARRYR